MADLSGFFTQTLQTIAESTPAYRQQQQELANIDQTRTNTANVQAKTFEQQLANTQAQNLQNFQARMAALAKGSDAPDPKNPESVADYMEKRGVEEMQAGFVNDGARMVEEGAKLRTQGINARRAAAMDRKAALEVEQERNDAAAAALYGVNNPEDFAKAIKGTKLEGMQYSPGNVRLARERLMGLDEQNKEKYMDAKRVDEHEKHQADMEKHRAEMKRIEAWERVYKERAKTQAGKVAKQDINSPTKQDLQNAENVITGRYHNLDAQSLKYATTIVASDARRLVNANHISYSEALAQAMKNRKDAFQFSDSGIFSKAKTTFQPSGKSFEDPIDLPAVFTKSHDPDDLEKGAWYNFTDGRVGQWSGTGWKNVRGGEDDFAAEDGTLPPGEGE